MLNIKTALLIACSACSPAVIAGPFGLDMGAKVEKMQGVTPSKQAYAFDTKRVPQPHPTFRDFMLVSTPETGLCKIVAFGGPTSTSAYGTEARTEFEKVEKALQQKYGEPERFQFLRSDSIWKEDREWMMGLLKKEREHSSFWKSPTNSDHINTIGLEMIAVNSDAALVKLSYEFNNFKQCFAYIRAKDDASL